MVKRTASGLAAVLLVLATLVGAQLAQAPAAAASIPANPGQIITVRATYSWSQQAQVTGWNRTATGYYVRAWGPYTAWIGYAGMGSSYEQSGRTPAGIYTITQGFSNAPRLTGTRLPWFVTDNYDWWNENPYSPYYNLHVRSATNPGMYSEHLRPTGYVYNQAVVFNANPSRTPWRGSGYFLHYTNGRPTLGCVAFASWQLDGIIRWLDPARTPIISLGVGSAATKIISDKNAYAKSRNPRGYVDIKAVNWSNRTLHYAGWTWDPDSPATSLAVTVYMDGAIPIATLPANVYRPDVNRAFAITGNHGYNFSVALRSGTHSYKVVYHNIGYGAPGSTQQGGITVTA